jgi:hypothetical protein
MSLAGMLDISDRQQFSIDWEITPTDTFTMFESWGGRNGERIRNNDEKFYYFYVDAWESPAALNLMERGVRYARILARIRAPQDLIDNCVTAGGRSATLDRSYAITAPIRDWLLKKVVNEADPALIIPIKTAVERQEMSITGLPGAAEITPAAKTIRLRGTPEFFNTTQVEELIRANNYYDGKRNPSGAFTNYLVDNGDEQTVTDQTSGLMWQRQGCDIANIQRVRKHVEELNRQEFGGHKDWRLPTLDEAMSLMAAATNIEGLHLHPCFSRNQPFIFTADQRRPGGYWFVDYKQGAAFWASGTIPGGFGRACRSV